MNKFKELYESIISEITYNLIKSVDNRYKNATLVFTDGKYVYKELQDSELSSTGIKVPEDTIVDDTKHPESLKPNFAEKYSLITNYRLY